KLCALQSLVQEQLDQGHIEPSNSPWNAPVFVIKKKSGKWRLLHDLRQVNAVMESMGALKPGMPSPTMIPREWDICVIDLKDWFFTILLHPDDALKFIFTVLTVNNQEPFLPQGMKNSPTICQWYVALALSTVRKQFTNVYCYHYMDDILTAAPTKMHLQEVMPVLRQALEIYGLHIAPEKAQTLPLWKYLGVKILDHTIQPQPIQINDEVKTLNDVQKLLGTINWLRPLLGITNSLLSSLFQLLKGDSDL
ncbi:hypothetical protein N341_09693, partial [Tyto alba]